METRGTSKFRTVLVVGLIQHYIIDLNDGQRYELIDLNQMPLLDT